MTDSKKLALASSDTVCVSTATGSAWTFDARGNPKMMRGATFRRLVADGFLEKSDSNGQTDFYSLSEAAKAELAEDRPRARPI